MLAHMHERAHMCACTRARTHTQKHAHTSRSTEACMHARTHACAEACTWGSKYAWKHIRTEAHHMHERTNACNQTPQNGVNMAAGKLYRVDWEPAATSGKCMAGVPRVFWRSPAVLQGPSTHNPTWAAGKTHTSKNWPFPPLCM